jgi:hypothetical protein
MGEEDGCNEAEGLYLEWALLWVNGCDASDVLTAVKETRRFHSGKQEETQESQKICSGKEVTIHEVMFCNIFFVVFVGTQYEFQMRNA